MNMIKMINTGRQSSLVLGYLHKSVKGGNIREYSLSSNWTTFRSSSHLCSINWRSGDVRYKSVGWRSEPFNCEF